VPARDRVQVSETAALLSAMIVVRPVVSEPLLVPSDRFEYWLVVELVP